MSDARIEDILKEIKEKHGLVIKEHDPAVVACLILLKVLIEEDENRSMKVRRELSEKLQECMGVLDDKEKDMEGTLGIWGGRIIGELQAGLDRVKEASKKIEGMLEQWDKKFEKSKDHIANLVKQMEDSLKKGGVVKGGGDVGKFYKCLAWVGVVFMGINALALIILLFTLPK